MSERKSDSPAVDQTLPQETVYVLTVRTIVDDCEVKICCQRTNGADRVFSTDMDWLRAEGPSESTLPNSVEALLPDIIKRCLHFVGDVVSVRAGFLSKERVETIISGVRLKMEEISNQNGVWREADIVTKASELRLSPSASNLDVGIWIARCPGTNHSLQMQPQRNLFYCGYCRVGAELDSLPRERNTAGEST